MSIESAIHLIFYAWNLFKFIRSKGERRRKHKGKFAPSIRYNAKEERVRRPTLFSHLSYLAYNAILRLTFKNYRKEDKKMKRKEKKDEKIVGTRWNFQLKLVAYCHHFVLFFFFLFLQYTKSTIVSFILTITLNPFFSSQIVDCY